MKTREQSVKDAIASIKSGNYKGTHIKVELEGQLNRNDYDDDYDRYEECDDCGGSGEIECICEEEAPPEGESCSYCLDEGWTTCGNCDGSGRWERRDDESYDDDRCHNFMLDNVSQAVRNRTVYSAFCNDGSVDSEFMVTVPIDHPEDVLAYIDAFKDLAEYIGNGLDVQGAGMHITILRSPDGNYPTQGSFSQRYLNNFGRQMNRLMPALLMLSSEDHKSRGLHYRVPGVSIDKYYAVHAVEGVGVFEFRCFETCYDHPEMFYDFLCVIAKCLEFYSDKQVRFGSKIGLLEFYDDRSKYGLHKYFQHEKMVKTLEQGLKYLCPDHRTPEECKRIRNLKVSPAGLQRRKKRLYEQLDEEWLEVKKNLKKEEAKFIAFYLERCLRDKVYETGGLTNQEVPTPDETEEWVNDAKAVFRQQTPTTKRAYIRQQERARLFSGDKWEIAVN